MIWADVEDTLGNKVGEGGIHSLEGFSYQRPLSSAGRMSCAIPLADSKSALVDSRTAQRYLHFWQATAQGPRELGLMIVEQPRVDVGRGLLHVEGYDVMRELAWVDVGSLYLHDVDTRSPDAVYSHKILPPDYDYVTTLLSNAFDGNTGTVATVSLNAPPNQEENDWLYIRKDSRFEGATFDLGSIVNNGPNASPTLRVQYPNGEGWYEPPNVVDGTIASGKTLNQDGAVTWDPPLDWVRGNFQGIEGWYVRIGPAAGYAIHGPSQVDIQINEITIEAHVATADDLQPIIDTLNAQLPAERQWALDPAYATATLNGSLIQFSGENGFVALERMSQLHGFQFRLGEGRVLQVLFPPYEASGLVAVQGVDWQARDNPDICLIDNLAYVADTIEIKNRVYGFGAGNGSARLTTQLADLALPAGYSYGSITVSGYTRYYIQHDTSVAQYGVRQQEEQFPEIGEGPSWTVEAANQLALAAVSFLEQHALPGEFYELSVYRLSSVLLPGQTIKVEHRSTLNPYLVIDEALNVLEVDEAITPTNGARYATLKVSTLARWLETSADRQIDQARRERQYRAHSQPAATLYRAPADLPDVNGGGGSLGGAVLKSITPTIDQGPSLGGPSNQFLAAYIHDLIVSGAATIGELLTALTAIFEGDYTGSIFNTSAPVVVDFAGDISFGRGSQVDGSVNGNGILGRLIAYSRDASGNDTVGYARGERGRIEFFNDNANAWNANAVNEDTGLRLVVYRDRVTEVIVTLRSSGLLELPGGLDLNGALRLPDGMTAPGAVVGEAQIYVDSADGDLKVKFGDGVTKTLATDT